MQSKICHVCTTYITLPSQQVTKPKKNHPLPQKIKMNSHLSSFPVQRNQNSSKDKSQPNAAEQNAAEQDAHFTTNTVTMNSTSLRPHIHNKRNDCVHKSVILPQSSAPHKKLSGPPYKECMSHKNGPLPPLHMIHNLPSNPHFR